MQTDAMRIVPSFCRGVQKSRHKSIISGSCYVSMKIARLFRYLVASEDDFSDSIVIDPVTSPIFACFCVFVLVISG